MAEKKSSKTKQSFALAIGQLAALALNFIMPFFLTRMLSKSAYGGYSQFNMLSLFILTVFAFGFPATLYYFEPRSSDDQRRALIGNTLLALMLGSLIASCLMIIPATGNILLGDSDLRTYLPIICLCVIVLMPTEVLEPLYVLLKDINFSMWYPPAIIIVKVSVVVFCTLIFSGLQGVFTGLIITDISILCVCIFYCFIKTRKPSGSKCFSLQLMKQQIKYILPFSASLLLNNLSRRLDKIICISCMTAEKYASYATAFWGIPGIQQIYNSISNVYLVSMSDAFIQDDRQQVLNLLHEMMTKLFSITLPSVLIVEIYAQEIITFVFTEKYLDAVPFFRLYSWGLIFLLSGTCLVIRASGKMRYSLYSYCIAAAITIPGTFLGIKYYGAYGGIISALCAQLLPKFLQAAYEMHILKVSLRKYLPWSNIARITAAAFVSLIPFAILRYYVIFNIFISALLAACYILLTIFVELKMDVALIENKSACNILRRLHLNVFVRFLEC